jgi:potassium channel subfamily K
MIIADPFPIELLNGNTHDKNHLLVKAIKRVAIDHIKNQQNKSKPEYTFEDWEYIFYLMGVLDPCSEEPNIVNRDNDDGVDDPPRLQSTGLEEWTEGGQILDCKFLPSES